MMNVIWEMETGDPDDFLTLVWLADHPQVDLLAVNVTPGSDDQCRLVRWGLDQCGRTDVPIGSLMRPEDDKSRVSGWHYKTYGQQIRAYDPGAVHLGSQLVERLLTEHSAVTYIIGSAPKNLGQAPIPNLARLVQQGGFAGANLTEGHMQLSKFKDMLTCPSYNPNGDPKAVLRLCADPNIQRRLFVSKNVCHGVIWDQDTQSRFKAQLPSEPRWGLNLMVHGLDSYLQSKGRGKAMHDLVAAAVAVDESVCTFSGEVEIYRAKGKWGARANPNTDTYISLDYDQQKFIDVLSGTV